MQVGRRSTLALVCFACAWAGTLADAKPGALDDTFSHDGVQTIHIPGGSGFPEDVAVQTDGRIVVAGGGGFGTFAVARLTPRGSLDENFASDGVWTSSLQNSRFDDGGASSVVVQPDGRIVVAGYISTMSPEDYEQSSHLILLRLLSNGEPDPTFGVNGVLDLEIATTAALRETVGLALQDDGKLIAGLSQASGRSGLEVVVARVNPDGVLDPTFAADGRAEVGFGSSVSELAALELDPEGRILVAGTASRGHRSSLGVMRLTSAGALDPTFSRDGRVTTRVGSPYTVGSGLAVATDGGVIVVGGAADPSRDPDETTSRFALARFAADGRFDPRFSGDGKRTLKVSSYSAATAVAAEPGGRFVVTGRASTRGNRRSTAIPVLRFTSRGSLDRTFGRRGIVEGEVGRPGSLGPVGWGITTQPDGRIVVVGHAEANFHRVEFAVLRYRPE